MRSETAKRLKARRAACLCLTAVMAGSLAAGNALAFAQNGKSVIPASSESYGSVSFENVTGQLDLSAIALQNLSPSVLENAGYATSSTGTHTVIVSLDTDCVLDSMPAGTTASDYISTYAGSRALKKIEQSQINFLNQLSSLGVKYKVVNKYSNVTNAVAISVDTAYISTIKSISSVKSTYLSETYAYPEAIEETGTTDYNYADNVYATGIYNSSKYVEQGMDGSGMKVAILDTGLDYTHEAFSTMPDTNTLELDKNDLKGLIASSQFKAVERSALQGKTINENDLYVNDKVPFAYDYADDDTDVYPSYSQHGTHVAGIISGQADSYKNKDGEIATDENGDPIPFSGVAPNAQLIICKVFTDDFESKNLGGAVSEDIIAALDDCVALGVDIINMSLGTTAGFSTSCLGSDDEGVELTRIYRRLKEVGISLIAAASNDFSAGYGSAFGTNLTSNPDSGTVGSPSTFDGAVSVASVNGQQSPFLKANGTDSVFFTDSSDANGVKFDFIKQMLGDKTNGTFKYVVVNGYGQASDYDAYVRRELEDKSQGKTVALVMRGVSTFQEKVQLAKNYGADAIIIYNNVAGAVGMSLGDMTNPIPAISISQEDGQKMLRDANGYKRDTGVIELDVTYQSGPYMNDYSSWGSTPDLKLKPDITSHGGEITSTVAGGYAEMSGTSMATPNLAGFVALLRSYLKNDSRFSGLEAVELTRLVNQIMMSTATMVYDQNGLPYSPRKQGAGLATLDNVFSTNAYLYTLEGVDFGAAEDNRPKIELGEDESKTGVYTLKFYVTNFGDGDLTFTPKATFMTESLSYDKLAVAERAYLMDGSPVWKVDGQPMTGDKITVGRNASVSIECTLTLSDADRKYLDANFVNGMYVEGFIQLMSETAGQCNLILPYMGFYGDWESAPMLDYDAYTLARLEQEAVNEEDKPNARVWATQAYATYYNEKYSVPLGSYLYVQDENASQKVYTESEHSAISMHNVYNGEDATNNYMTANGIKALYAGLLRNAELVTYDLVDAYTGEVLLSNNVYSINKAHSSAGSPVPAQVKLDLDPVTLGLEANGKYELNFHFYFKASDAEDESKVNDDNTFSMIFYVDYEAPVLESSRVRYYDYKEGNKDKQRIYLDLDIYDNHYAQSVMLCYSETETDEDNLGAISLNLATDYITPIYNANKNGTTTVTIEITDIYDKYKGSLYVQIDDYALNHSIYALDLTSPDASVLPDSFDIAGDKEITIGINEPYKIELVYDGEASLSNFTWDVRPNRGIEIKNGEIFATVTGTYTVTVRGAGGVYKTVTVHVIDKGLTLPTPTLSFGVIKNDQDSLQKATGTVNVNAGQTINLYVEADTWYYPVSSLQLHWESDNPEIATVDQNGVVTTMNTKGSATISAIPIINGQQLSQAYAAIVTLSVQDPFTISNYALTSYHGSEEYVVIPANKNVMTISSEAFKDNTTMKYVVIPKTVTQISEKAFVNCSNLEAVYFIDEVPDGVTADDIIPDSSLATIMSRAFENCTNLKLVDLRNCKTITVDRYAFNGCTSLEKIENMAAIGTMYQYAFKNCTSLTSVDLTGLHVSGEGVFSGCTSLENVETAYYTAFGAFMFDGCSKLGNITVSTPTVAAYAFANSGIKTVTFDKAQDETRALSYNIGEFAFYNCAQLTSVDFKNNEVSYLGDCAFADCTNLATVNGLNYSAVADKGVKIFSGTKVTGYGDDVDTYGAIYSGTVLVLSPDVIPTGFTIRAGTTEIAPYAFEGSKGAVGITVPASVKVIGEGAFADSQITGVTLPSDLKEIPAYAFAGSGITSIVVPASVTFIGASAFADCASLATVTFESGRTESLTIGASAFFGCSSLTAVELPEITDGVLASGTFAYCTSLERIDLANVTQLGDGYEVTVKNGYIYFGAFANCTALTDVAALENMTSIGAYAFINCAALESLTLTNATYIGAYAFGMPDVEGSYSSVSIPVAQNIGSFAFAGGKEVEIKIPASLTKLGSGAFASSTNLAKFTVEDGSQVFFEKDGVLYRIISGSVSDGEFELCSYPSAYRSPSINEVAVYSIAEGTVTVKAFAFFGLNANYVQKVIFPYSIKTIGTSAFYSSGVTDYEFRCITAPVLLNDYVYNYALTSDGEQVPIYSFYNLNFNGAFFDYGYNSTAVSPLKISYPTNGVGYDNFVYRYYFGAKTLLGELMDDTTRTVKGMIEGFISAAEVSAWNTAEVNAENKAIVEAFSNSVKEAHALFNTITSQTQLDFLGAENIQKLYDIETELKSVKARFGIKTTVLSLAVSPDSTYKKDYVTGEKFNINGLKLIVTYDDYSTEIIDDVSLISINENYAGELSILNKYVVVEYGGKTVMVSINVTDGAANGGNKVNPAVIYGPIIGVVLAAGIAVAVVFLLKKFKKPAKKATEGDTPEEEKADDKDKEE